MNQNNFQNLHYTRVTHIILIYQTHLCIQIIPLQMDHQLRFSTTSDGTHGGGVAFTDGVTRSVITLIPIGTAGSFIQITVSGTGTLYYYCVNHVVWVIK